MGLNYCWDMVTTGNPKGKLERGHFLNTAETVSWDPDHKDFCPTQRLEWDGGKSLSTVSVVSLTLPPPATETNPGQGPAA